MGGKRQLLVIGPCAAESDEQLYATAKEIYDLQIPLHFFRVGVWKPRTNPNDFLGIGEKAFPILKKINHDFQFPICTEVANAQHVKLCIENKIDAVWIGTRTTVNPFAVQEIADALKGSHLKVMVKNPIIPDIKLWFGAIERIQKAGIKEIFAIHRGFAHETNIKYRNTPSWEIPIAFKAEFPDIPVLCDASHIAGNKDLVQEIAQSGINYGLEGMMIEVHHQPCNALCDAKQQLTPMEFIKLYQSLSQRTNPQESNLLEIQRGKIQHIDKQISQLLYERMATIDVIAQLKKENNLSLVDHTQWRKVIQQYSEIGKDDAHYQQFIKMFLELLHQQSIDRQTKY